MLDVFACIEAFISIHSPHARGDSTMATSPLDVLPFQSTPLTRGETAGAKRRHSWQA